MPAGTAVAVEGLSQLVRDLGRARPELRRQLRAELKQLAGVVADEAKSIADRVMERESGDLVGSIKPTVRSTMAIVRATARHRGYRYPGRMEFGDLDRPFLHPALAAKRGDIARGFEDAIDRTLTHTNLI